MSYIPQRGEIWNYCGVPVLITGDYAWGHVPIKVLDPADHRWHHDYGGTWFNFYGPFEGFNPNYQLVEGCVNESTGAYGQLLKEI